MPKVKNDISVTVSKGCMVISIPMEKKPKPSGSGKSLVVASTRGIYASDLEIDGKTVKIGVNAFIENK